MESGSFNFEKFEKRYKWSLSCNGVRSLQWEIQNLLHKQRGELLSEIYKVGRLLKLWFSNENQAAAG